MRNGGVQLRSRTRLLPVLLLLVALGLGWFALTSEPRSSAQWATSAGAVVAVVSAVYLLVPRRR
ncbi:MAG: hypothetical protein ABI051_11220 [Vicinamibacterales bacterium]